MNIADMQFGTIDARHEILARDPAKRKLFLESFFTPNSFSFAELESGDKYIIVGPKGSGKTASLRYLQHKLGHDENSPSQFIVFRDDVTTQDRDKLTALSKFRIYDSEQGDVTEESDLDYTSAWQLFIHREIAHLISKSSNLCAKTQDVHNYIKLLNGFFASFKTSDFKNLLQKITKGRIKLQSFGQGIEVEAEFVDSHGNIDISEFLRYCNATVEGLDFNAELTDPRINIFFDEVNINFVSGVKFKRDAILIRDLVAACGKLNALFAEHSLPIFVYTAIRSEVVDSIEGSVRELQKWVDDKAVKLDWYDFRLDYKNQPLIELIRQRFAANEKALTNKEIKLGDISLLDYFERKIHGHRVENFLLFETWGRPRDVVRLLSHAKQNVGRGQKFSNEAFSRSFSDYSHGCWEEKSDELNSKYSKTEIGNIKRLLTAFDTSFSFAQLESRISHLSRTDPRANQFFSGRILASLLEDLFRVGIIGNMLKSRNGGPKPSYLYMGHNNFNSDEPICVHRSLWRELDIEKKPVGVMAEGLARSRNRRGK